MTSPKILYDLEYSQGSVYGTEEEQALVDAFRAGAVSCGPRVAEFERAFAGYCGVEHGVAVTSATAGLYLAMQALGIGPGDEVITTPLSWVSTANAAAAFGATVVFADVDRRTLNIDPASVASKVTSRTRAIIPVHLFGQCCDMDALMDIARSRGIIVVEDCAHAAGASCRGRKAGSLGDMGVFSFHRQKNMSTLGEGGMVTTGNTTLYDAVFSLRSHAARAYGPRGKYLSVDESVRPMGLEYWYFDFDGVAPNQRMTDVQAAVGLVQLGKLDLMNARRREIAERYSRGLGGIAGLTLPRTAPGNEHAFHIYCVQVERDFPRSKEEFMWEMYTGRGVRVWQHYMPIHLTTAYRHLGHGPGECPIAEEAFHRYVSLPIHPRLTEAGIDYLIDSVRAVAAQRSVAQHV
jgi:dTDP-4-amino-4,6-dideoxygalactose transaminase